jgi:hypothetical protein
VADGLPQVHYVADNKLMTERVNRRNYLSHAQRAPSKGILKKSTNFENENSSSPDEGFSDELKKVREKLGTCKTISFID